jgi:DNA modification methylase
MSSPVMARKSYARDWPRCQGRSGSVDAVFQSVFRQFGSAAQPAANRIHPTAKPVELIERALLNSSKAGDVVSTSFADLCITTSGSVLR